MFANGFANLYNVYNLTYNFVISFWGGDILCGVLRSVERLNYKARLSVHSRSADGTIVLRNQRPARLGAIRPDHLTLGTHSRLRWDIYNQKI